MDLFSRQRLTGWLLVVLVLLNLLTLGTLWYRELTRPSFTGPEREAHFRHRMEQRFIKEVGLDPQQIKQFDAKRDEFLAKMRSSKKDIKRLNVDIMNQAFAENPDTNLVLKKSQEIADIESGLAMDLFHHIQDLKELARPDQRQKLQRFFNNLLQKANPPGPPPAPDELPNRN